MKPRAGSQVPVPAVVREGKGNRAIVLVGFMGAGKTSVGRLLGTRLGWPFEDLDDRIRAREKRSIEAIFRDGGEAAFRGMERAALQEVVGELKASPRIVALGGGAFARPENAALLETVGARVVFLDASVDELYRRCQQEPGSRPLQRDAKQFRELYEQRRPFYLAAGWRIDTSGKNLDAVAAEVACSLGLE